MCDDQPIGKLEYSSLKPTKRHRKQRVQYIAPEDYIHPAILRQHMRPISDILQAQHYAATRAADLTNSCITITTVCKELVC